MKQITKDDLQKRLAEVEAEETRYIAQAQQQLGAYAGVKDELRRMISSFDSEKKVDDNTKKKEEVEYG